LGPVLSGSPQPSYSLLAHAGAKVEYDAGTDTLTVIFKNGVVAESEEGKPGVILDLAIAGHDGRHLLAA